MAQRSPTFQFSLIDMFFVIALISLGMLLAPNLLPRYYWLSSTTLGIEITFITVGMGLFAFWRVQVGELTGEARMFIITWYVALGWGACLMLLYTHWVIPLLFLGITYVGALLGKAKANRKGHTVTPPLTYMSRSIGMIWAEVFTCLFVLGSAPNAISSRRSFYSSTAVSSCKTFVAAQQIYHRTDWDADGVLEYARSVSGDYSLYERFAGMGDVGLVDPAFARASVTNIRQRIPRCGYFFKVLETQGPNVQGGKRSYLDANGNMTHGFALVAWPVPYEYLTRMSYLIDQSGSVYQKDLGSKTSEIISNMTEYNPDETWELVE